MSQAPITFRCYRCNQPLGAPARKAGAVVNCPQCGSELKIPVPKPPSDLDDLQPEDIRVAPEFANVVVPPSPTKVAQAGGDPPTPTEIEAGAEDEVVLPSIRVDPPSITAREDPRPGVREVTLSPAVVLAWSLLVLLAVPLAFLAGLLTGHFIWK